MLIIIFSHANDNINMKDRELKSLRRQLDSTSDDLSENSRGKEVALRENRRLQDDLSVMTRENQVCSGQIIPNITFMNGNSSVLKYLSGEGEGDWIK